MKNDFNPILAAFMDIGATGIVPRQILEKRSMIEESGINRESPDFWSGRCASLSHEESKNLFKGLVIVERELDLGGGSVSGNIWVLRYLDRILKPTEIFDLVDWAFEHRRDSADFTPLGVAIRKDMWKQVEPNVLETFQGDYLGHLRTRAVEIRKGMRRK